MILSGKDIEKALEEARVVIEPAPSKDAIDTTSIDLHIGEPMWIWNPDLNSKQHDPFRINLEEYNYPQFSEENLIEVPKDNSGRYQIKPQQVYLTSTYEKVQFPAGSRLAGRVEGKSSLARLGLVVHMTAPMIHCGTGFGIITLEIFNHGPFILEATPEKTRICQLLFEEVSSEPEERTGRMFMEQKDAKG